MADHTAIEWTDATFNPWWGCERVSPGCAHCYADTFARRFGMDELWQKGGEHGFRFFGERNWAEPLKWARTLPEKLGRRPRVFCASMADVFEDDGDLGSGVYRRLDEERERLWLLIEATPELDWLILTKRPEVMREWLGAMDPPWPNAWLGVSIENARYTWRADVLREIPAAVRFISAEPLLGSLYPHDPKPGTNQRHAAPVGQSRTSGSSGQGAHGPNVGRGSGEANPITGEDPVTVVEWRTRSAAPLDLTGIDWIIIGGESGPGARPFHLEHAREIIRATLCADCGGLGWIPEPGSAPDLPNQVGCERCGAGRDRPAIFVKQLGSRPVEVVGENFTTGPMLLDRKGGDPDEWPTDLRIREWPRTPTGAAA